MFYVRYVDDIFVLMKYISQLNSFFHEMKTLYSNGQLTLVRSTDSMLSFLNTEVNLIPNRLHTDIFRKPTDTNVVISTLVYVQKHGRSVK